MGAIKRRTRTAESIVTTVRYDPQTYEKIRGYAYRHKMSFGCANEELVRRGLEKADLTREAS